MSYDYLRSAPIRRLHHPLEENLIWRILGSAITSVFAIAIALPFLLAFFLLLPACLSVRWLLLLIHWNRRGSHSGHGPETVRGNDSRWLGAAWTSSVIHSVLVFEANDKLTVENFRHLLLTRVIPLYPRLMRRPISLPLSAGIGHCWLQDTNFSIDRHVFAGPPLSTEKDLQNYVSKLLKDGLSQDKPPWELQILSFGDGKDTVAVLRVHQSVADGTALLRVLCQSLADSQEIQIPQGPKFGSYSFCVNVFRACIVGPLSLLVWLFFSAEDCNILTHRSAWTGSLTVAWSASITLPKVIRIKQVTRSTVNCVLLSALAGALRRFLQGCGVKHPPDIKAVLPMDLRNPKSTRLSSRLGNKSSPVFVSLPVAVEGCIPRLWTIRKALNSLRNSADPIILYVATKALMSVGPSSIARGLIDSITDKASLQFSSLPGPTSQICVGGQTLKAIYPLLPAQARLGISITAITYADQVFVSVIAERALEPAAELILEYLEEQIEALWNLLLHRRVPGEGRSSFANINHFDAMESTTEEITNRLSAVQQEVQRINENCDDDEEALCNLRNEFTKLIRELKRRNTLNEMYKFEFLRKHTEKALVRAAARKRLNESKKTQAAQKKERSSAEHDEGPSKTKEQANLSDCKSENTHLLADSPQNVDGNHTKNKLPKRLRNIYEEDGDGAEISIGCIEINEKDQNSDSGDCIAPLENYNESPMEMVLEIAEHAKYPSKLNVNPNESNGEYHEHDETTTFYRTNEKNSRKTAGSSWRDCAGHEVKKSHGEPECNDDQPKHLGPINSDLRDLYCSNYLQHKLEMLRMEKDRLEREMMVCEYAGLGHRRRCYDDQDDEEIDGGVLI